MASLLQALQALADTLNQPIRKDTQEPRSTWDSLWLKFSMPVSWWLRVLLIILVFAVLFSDSFKKNTIFIEPFATCPELQSKGYTDQVIAAQFADRVSSMIRDPRRTKVAQEFTLPVSVKLPDLEVPAAHTSVKTVLRYIQEFALFKSIRRFFGFTPIRVSGEALLEGEKVMINLRITRDTKDGTIIEAKKFTKDFKDLELLFTEAGEHLLLYAEPYLFAVYLYRNDKTDEALAQIQYCLYHHPDEYSCLALTLWGKILINQDRFDEAIVILKEATRYEKPGEIRRDLAGAYNNWGMALLLKRKMKRAIHKFHEALKRDPDYAMAYNNLGKVYLDREEYEKATIELKEAIKRNPDLIVAYYNLALALSSQHKLQDAISLYHLVLINDPTAVKAYINLSQLLIQLTPPLYDEAIGTLDKALDIDRKSPIINYNLGSVYLAKSKFRDAIPKLKTAVELYDKEVQAGRRNKQFLREYANVCNDLGWACEKADDLKPALRYYLKSTQASPDYYGLGHNGCGDVLVKLGRFDDAIMSYENVIKNAKHEDETRVEAYIRKSRVYLIRCRNCTSVTKRKAIEMAISVLNEAKGEYPGSDKVLNALAEANTMRDSLPKAEGRHSNKSLTF